MLHGDDVVFLTGDNLDEHLDYEITDLIIKNQDDPTMEQAIPRDILRISQQTNKMFSFSFKRSFTFPAWLENDMGLLVALKFVHKEDNSEMFTPSVSAVFKN